MISNLEFLAFRKDNLTYSLSNHDFSRHDLIHVSFGADPSAHGGIDWYVLISDNDFTILDSIGGYWCCVLDLENVSFFIGVIGCGGFAEFDLHVELGVAFHGYRKFELT